MILVWMKMKMKNALISSIFNGWAKIDEDVIDFVTHDVVHGRHHMASYLTWIAIINPSCKHTCD
jgi:hypothetical protein